MKKQFYAFMFITTALAAGCSKSTPEPEPSEQVIGVYTVDKLSETLKYASSPSEQSQSYILPYKDNQGNELSAELSVSKTASNIVTITYSEKAKYANGTTDSNTDSYPNIELKKATTSGMFDMYDGATAVGSIGNGSVTLEDAFSSKDSLGRAFTYTFRITGKKK